MKTLRGILSLLVLSLLVPGSVIAEGVLTPAANPSNSVLYDYRTTIEFQEEFGTGNTSSGLIGQLGWFTAGGTFSLIDSETNRVGIVRKDTSSSSGTVSHLILSANQRLYNAANTLTWKWVVRPNQIDANTTMRIGQALTCTISPITTGIYFERLDADTNWFAVTNEATDATRTNTGVAATASAWVTLAIEKVSNASVKFYINGALVATHTTDLPSTQNSPCAQIVNSTAASKTLDFDYWETKITGIAR